MEKRILAAFLLSAIFLAWYGRQISRWTGSETRPAAEAPVAVEAPAPAGDPPAPVLRALGEEPVTRLDAPSLRLEVGQTSGAVRRVVLKTFQETGGEAALRFGGELPIVNLEVANAPLTGQLIASTSQTATIQAQDILGNDYHISYAMDTQHPVAEIIIQPESVTQHPAGIEFVTTYTWARGDDLGGRYNALELYLISQDGAKLKHKRYNGPFKAAKDVPRGTSWVSLSERYFCQSVKFGQETDAMRLLPSPGEALAVQARFPLSALQAAGEQRLTLYVGPRDYFHLKEAGFEGAFPIGILGQIGLALLVLLSGITKVVHNYGLGIIVLAGIITGAMAPFTIMSYRSMRKMQELKPEMDRLMAKHKQDPKRMQQEVFGLYKQHRVSPMSGCLPMLLQLPIFIAFFQAISHYIELRGEGFLWIEDLSLPDQLAHLPFSLPLIGDSVNALPIIMAAAMFVQTRLSQGQMGSAQNNPMAKMMSGPIMPVIFCLMFYQFPAGLVLYWLTNTLMSLLWYRLAR